MKMRRRKIKKTMQNQTANHPIERNHLQRIKRKAQTKRRMLPQKKVRSQAPKKKKEKKSGWFSKKKKVEEEDKSTVNLDSLLVLKDIDLKVKKGEFVCVIGDVGAGKSSLLSSIIGDHSF